MKGLRKNYLSFFKKIWPVGLLLIIVLAFFWKIFLKGQVPFPGDFVLGIYYPWLDYKWGFPAGVPVKNPIVADVPSFIWPMLSLGIKMIKEGQLPLWNPYILAGNPLLANFQSAPFSITNIFYFLLPVVDAWGLQIVMQHVFAALFMYLLLRYWRASKIGSILGGIIFAFSGFNLIWSQWNGHTLSAAFIPLILYLEDRLLKERKILFGAFLSLVLALQLYSGYPQVVLYTAIAMGVLWVIRIATNFKDGLKNSSFLTLTLVVFGILGIGLAASQWLPGAELLKSSQRAVEYHPFEWAFLPWVKTITFIAPDFFGNHAARNYWGPQDYTSNTGMVGVVAFALAITALGLAKKKKEVVFAICLAVTSLIMAFPTPFSVFLWKSGFLGFNAAAAHRSLILFNLAMAALAGFGYDFIGKTKLSKLKLFSIIIPFVMLVGFGIYAYAATDKSVYGAPVFPIAIRNLILPSAILVATAFIILIRQKLKAFFAVLAIVELFYFGWKFTPFFSKDLIFPSTPILDFLTKQEKPFRLTGSQVIPMNMRMVYGLESPEGYDAVYPARTSRLIFALNDSKSFQGNSGRYGFIDREDSKILDLMNTKYFLALKLSKNGEPSPQGDHLLSVYENPKFEKVFEDKSVVVLKNNNALPRAFMVYDWEVISDGGDELEELINPSFPLPQKIILSEAPEIKLAKRNLNAKNEVEYQDYRENSSVIKVSTDQPGFLFISETFYPGWKAYLDGKEIKIYRADYNFRAIEIPQGEHIVRFDYHPDTFYNGLKVSAVSGLVIVGVIGYTLIKRHKDEDA